MRWVTKRALPSKSLGKQLCLGFKRQPQKEAASNFFQTAGTAAFEGIDDAYPGEMDKGHGRLEIRRYCTNHVLGSLPGFSAWKGLNTLGLVERECVAGGASTIEQRYFINPIPACAKQFAHAVRGCRGIGNYSISYCLSNIFYAVALIS